MPTVGIYVPMGTARAVAHRFSIDPDHPLFEELVRSLCAEALDDVTGGRRADSPFDPGCANAAIHKSGWTCRRCYGR